VANLIKESAKVIILLRLTTDGHTASRSLSARAELLVTSEVDVRRNTLHCSRDTFTHKPLIDAQSIWDSFTRWSVFIYDNLENHNNRQNIQTLAILYTSITELINRPRNEQQCRVGWLTNITTIIITQSRTSINSFARSKTLATPNMHPIIEHSESIFLR